MNDTPQNIQVRTESVQNIANSIRTKNGSTDKYKIGEMSGAIDDLPTYIRNTTLSIENNGVYNVGEYEKASVDVPVPSGATTITTNGRHDVKNYIYADVNVPEPTGALAITTNGQHNVKDYEFANVNVPQPSGSTTITTNGTHDVTNYVSAVVDVPNRTKIYNYMRVCSSDVNYPLTQQQFDSFLSGMDFSEVTTGYYLFSNNARITYVPQIYGLGQLEDVRGMFYNCSNLTSLPSMDTSQVVTFQNFTQNVFGLINIPEYNCSSVTSNGLSGTYNLPVWDGTTPIPFSDSSWNNILKSCASVPSGYSSSNKKLYKVVNNLSNWLSNDSTLRTKIQNLQSYSAFTSAGWSID